MDKIETLASPDSCLNKAFSDEPLFVLRAQDRLAPQTIRHWVTMSARTQPEAKRASAMQIANEMEVWYQQNAPQTEPGPAVRK